MEKGKGYQHFCWLPLLMPATTGVYPELVEGAPTHLKKPRRADGPARASQATPTYFGFGHSSKLMLFLLGQGAGPAELQPDTGCPTRGSFTGGLLRTLPGMFIGHSETVAFLLYRFDADKPAPLLRRWILPLYYHKLLSAPSPSRDTPLSHLFLEVMEQIRRRHQFVVVGYVVMPEHVHLLFSEPELK
jgi:hypothetical protein